MNRLPAPNMARAFGDETGMIHASKHNIPAFGTAGPVAGNSILMPTNLKEEALANYNYAPKSKLIYQRKSETASQARSRTSGKSFGMRRNIANIGPHAGTTEETKSRLSRHTIQRFNEGLP